MRLDMEISEPNPSVLIIGAGVAGLTAAAELQRGGRSVCVLDKGRSVGGRLASRRIGEASFDHGAQFITTRDLRFVAALEGWRRTGVVEEWCRGFAGQADGHARWRGNPSMNSLAKHLARGLEVHLEQELVALHCLPNQWRAAIRSGEVYSASAVVLTPPVPQSLALMAAGGCVLAPEIHAQLAGIEYDRCLAVMAVLEGPSHLPPPGGLVPAEGPITWIADNQLKGISAAPAVTIHASPAFSLEHWEGDRQASGRLLLEAAADWLGVGIKTFQVHGWRYSKPVRVHEQACLIANESPLLVLAGDAFAGPKVEGAALSGWAAAEAILKSTSWRPALTYGSNGLMTPEDTSPQMSQNTIFDK